MKNNSHLVSLRVNLAAWLYQFNLRTIILYCLFLRCITVLTGFYTTSSVNEHGNNVHLLLAMMVLVIPSMIVVILLQSGFLFALTKLSTSIPFKTAWKIIWIITAITVSGEVVNQIILILINDPVLPLEKVRIGLNIFFSPKNMSQLYYLLLSEITPFSVLAMIILFHLLKFEKMVSPNTWLMTAMIFILQAGIKISMASGALS